MTDILFLQPVIHSLEQVTRADRCQIKDYAGFGLWPPISLAQAAAVLREDGYRLNILDAVAEKLSFDEMVARVVNAAPRIVVLQNTTPTLQDDLDVAEQVRKQLPETEFVFYGLHATARPEDILGGHVRFVIRDEPEMTLREVAGALTGRSNTSLGEIRGLSHVAGEKIHHGADRELIPDLSTLPYPAMDLLPLNRYVIPSERAPFWITQVGRGCPFRCIFCTSNPYYRNVWRVRPVPHVMGEIRQAVSDHGIHHFMFLSDTFNVKKEYVLDFCSAIRREGLNIRWVCNSRVDTFDEEIARAMKEAGCWLISFGIESGSDEILRRARKGATTAQAMDAIRSARRAGIKSLAYFIFGLPGETHETIRQTIRFATELDPDYAHFYLATPFPGTEFYRMAEREGWLVSRDWNRYYHGMSNVIEYPGLGTDEMKQAVWKAYRVFYRRPKVYLRELASIHSWRELRAKAWTWWRLLKEKRE